MFVLKNEMELLSFLFFFFLKCCFFAFVNGVTTNYRSVTTARLQGTWGKWGPFLTLNAKSRLHCAVLCTENVDCDLAEWDPETSLCHLHSEQNLVVFYPLTEGVATSTVMIGKPLQIVELRPWTGGYAFDFTAADQACKELDGRLITYSEMEAAYNAGWLHIGSCGYVSSGSAYYVLQYTVHGTGWGGIHNCYWSSTWDAFCYIPGPDSVATSDDDDDEGENED